MKRKILLLMSLTLVLTSSSFFLPLYISQNIDNDKLSTDELTIGESRGVIPAIKQLYSLQEKGSREWLRLAKKLARNDGEIANELAMFYGQQGNNKDTLYWLVKAKELGNKNARYALIEHLITEHNYNQAITLLSPILDEEKAFKFRVKVALLLGDVAFIKEQLLTLKDNPNATTQLQYLVNLIKKYKILAEDSYLAPNSDSNVLQPIVLNTSTINHCDNSIQFFATSLNDLQHVELLIEQFNRHKLAEAFCFQTVRYIPINELNCQYQQGNAIRCDESIWQMKSATISSRFIAVMLPQGGANVHLGMLYLDNQDTVEVLAHEVSHLLGFVDEYPLPNHHLKCAAVQSTPFAHNAVVLQRFYQGNRDLLRKNILKQLPWAGKIAKSTPILTATKSGWKLGTPKDYSGSIGVYPSSTCDNSNVSSFRPLARNTQLTYFELDFPKEYFEILKSSRYDFRMPSYHYNVALALFNKHQISEARIWLTHAAEFELKPKRKTKILKGDF